MTTSNVPVPTAAAPRKDLHQQITDTIIKQLEAGTIPWRSPWKGMDYRLPGMPLNATTHKKYRGINILLLWGASMEHQYSTSEWATFKQWKDQKEKIRKDEKGTMIVYYDVMEKEKEGEVQRIPFLKSSVVFNRCQLQSYTPKQEALPKLEYGKPFEPIDRIEQFVENTDAWIGDEGYGACYIGATDKIYMPHPSRFLDTDSGPAQHHYYATLFHELTHWTGHPQRLNRERHRKQGDKIYAQEELIAELGAAFLCSELDITAADQKDHASYIQGWLEVLKNDKYCVVKAAAQASKAVDYLQKLQPQ